MSVDKIGGFFVAMQQAKERRKKYFFFDYSKFLEQLASLLKREKFIFDYKVFEESESEFRKIGIVLTNDKNNFHFIGYKRLSTPSRRVYLNYHDLKKMKVHNGVIILSTSQAGLVTVNEAIDKRIGGEQVVNVY